MICFADRHRSYILYIYIYVYEYVYVDNREANVYEVRLDGEALLSREETKEHLALHHLSWRSFPLNLPGTSLCLACLDRFLSISRRDWCHKPTRSPHGITLHSKVPFSWNLPSPSSHPSNTSTSQSLCKATNMSHCEVETQVMIPIQNSTLNRIATAPSSVVSEMEIARATVRVSHLKIPMWIPLRRKIGRSAGPELEEDADELEEEEPPKNTQFLHQLLHQTTVENKKEIRSLWHVLAFLRVWRRPGSWSNQHVDNVRRYATLTPSTLNTEMLTWNSWELLKEIDVESWKLRLMSHEMGNTWWSWCQREGALNLNSHEIIGDSCNERNHKTRIAQWNYQFLRGEL